MIVWLVASSVCQPKFMVPRARRLTLAPVRPRWVYCIAGSPGVRWGCSRRRSWGSWNQVLALTWGRRGHAYGGRLFLGTPDPPTVRSGPDRPAHTGLHGPDERVRRVPPPPSHRAAARRCRTARHDVPAGQGPPPRGGRPARRGKHRLLHPARAGPGPVPLRRRPRRVGRARSISMSPAARTCSTWRTRPGRRNAGTPRYSGSGPPSARCSTPGPISPAS